MNNDHQNIGVGDLVREHTKSSKKRMGLVTETTPAYGKNGGPTYWLDIKWLDGSVDIHMRLRNIYEVTKVIDGEEYPNLLQDYIQGKRW